MKNADVVATLDDLIQTCHDSEAGFRACAEERVEQHFKVPFMDRAIDCAAASRALQALVVEHGGEPGAGAAPHRRWIDVRQAISGRDGKTVLDEIERGEDLALLSYRNALGRGLPVAIRAVVESQYQRVLRNHALVRLLRDEIPTSP